MQVYAIDYGKVWHSYQKQYKPIGETHYLISAAIINYTLDNLETSKYVEVYTALNKLVSHKCPVKVTPPNSIIEYQMYLIFSTELFFKLVYPTQKYTPCTLLVPPEAIKFIAQNWTDHKKIIKYFAQQIFIPAKK
jgi:hypothetical protein